MTKRSLPTLIVLVLWGAAGGVVLSSLNVSCGTVQSACAQEECPGSIEPRVAELESALASMQTELEALRTHDHPGVARAWVSFNGVGNIAVHKSFNVESVTRVGPGVFRIAWGTPFDDTNYIVTGTCNLLGSGGAKFGLEGNNIAGNIYEHLVTASADVGCRNSNNVGVDTDLVQVVVFDD